MSYIERGRDSQKERVILVRFTHTKASVTKQMRGHKKIVDQLTGVAGWQNADWGRASGMSRMTP